jgi:hypothetical protein
VRSRDSAPDDSDSASVDLTLGLVDVGDSLDVSAVQVMWVGSSLVWSGLYPSSIRVLMPLAIPHPAGILVLLVPWQSCSLQDPPPYPLPKFHRRQTKPTKPPVPPSNKLAHLSEVCPGVLRCVNTLNLDQRLVRSRVPLSSLVS